MKDPAFLFYSSDFLVGTMLMSNEEVGKYIRLMCLAHQKGGYLTKEDMFKICDTSDLDIINKFKVDGQGVYYNERLLSEITKRSKYSESRRNNRINKKEEKEETYDLHMSNTSNTYDIHMENENVNINNKYNSLSLNDNNSNKKEKIKKNNNEYEVLDEKEVWFNLFWKEYPKKSAKKNAKSQFMKIVKSKELLDKILEDIRDRLQTQEWTKNNGQFIPFPSTYLNQERWEDEVVIKKGMSFLDIE